MRSFIFNMLYALTFIIMIGGIDIKDKLLGMMLLGLTLLTERKSDENNGNRKKRHRKCQIPN